MQQWSPLWRTIGTRPSATFSTSTSRKKRDCQEEIEWMVLQILSDNIPQHPDNIMTTFSNILRHPDNILQHPDNILQHLAKMPSTWVRQVVCEGGWLLGRATPAEGFSIGTILTKTKLLAKMLMNVTRLVRKQSFMWRALSKCHLKIATKTKWTERITGTCTEDVLKSDKSI